MKNRLLSFLFAFFLYSSSQAQVLIVAIFGDKLNSDKIEFGLNGGFNRSWYFDREDSEGLNNFNLGFFFHIKMTENSTGYISTGVHVKSNVGASGMPTYPIGDSSFDEVYANGELTTQVNVFYLPIMWQQRLGKVYFEGGIQPGLRTKANDIFEVDDFGGELEFKRDVRDNYTRLDFGVVGGMGYRFKNERISPSLGLNFYNGLVDVYKPDTQRLQNSSLYAYIRIPIGAGAAEK